MKALSFDGHRRVSTAQSNLEGAVDAWSCDLSSGGTDAMSGTVLLNRSDASDDVAVLEWGNDVLTLEIAHSAGLAPHVACVRTGSVRLRMPAGLPLVDLVTLRTGHTPASDRLVHGTAGAALRYRSHRATEDADMSVLELLGSIDAEGLSVLVRLEARQGVAAVTSRVSVTAIGQEPAVLRSVSSFSTYLGASPSRETVPDWAMLRGSSDWLGEGRWERLPLSGRMLPGLEEQLTGHNPRGELRTASSGTWSTGRYLPTAVIESAALGAAWAWQIEHNGAWRFDVGQDTADRWFALSGPTDGDHQWTRVLAAGASFEAVPVTVTIGVDAVEAIGELTAHRRRSRRAHPDNAAMPVVFNDYMNTLNGDPTTEKLLPLIDAAAGVGAEVFCIDAGWYADGFWWDSVGEWEPSQQRFPGGLGLVLDHIRERGLVPGLWLEPEVIGVNSPMADRLPDEAFLQRHGHRVVEHERYLLDLRHPAAVAHLDEVVDRLVVHHGVGFFKFDYNVDPGPGTDLAADSVGEGLLQHNRAHLAWLDGVLDRHPELVVENCGSGAMRADFAMLSRLQMQSTSDQQDWTRYPPIAAAAPMQMLPEQAASWAYPQPEMSVEEVAFCLVTGLLGRFYLSGYLNRMDEPQRALVGEAVAAAKRLRADLVRSRPEWPLGLPDWDDDRVALALATDEGRLITVWDRTGDAEPVALRFPDLTGAPVEVDPVFPTSLPSWTTQWEQGSGTLRVHNPTGTVGARVFRIRSPRSGD